MNDRHRERVVLVTGASRGIGRAIALRFAKEGAHVVVDYSKNTEAAKAVIRQIEALGSKNTCIQADISRVESARSLVQEAVKAAGRVDVLINNAGMEIEKSFLSVTEEEYDKVLGVNLKGAFFTSQAFARHLLETKRPGQIINISSVHETLPFPGFASYCAAKGGIGMLTRTLAIELAPLGIRVNGIAPGAIETDINQALFNNPKQLNMLLDKIPLKRIGQPEDVAGIAAFLASSDANYVTGATYFVDGGLTWNYSEQHAESDAA